MGPDIPTLGPGERLHALSTPIAKNVNKPISVHFSMPSFRVGRSTIGDHLHPASRTALYVWVVALRVLTVVPVIGLLLLRFVILGRLLDDLRRSLIRAVEIGV
jgi:hypothetical protein